MTSKTTIQKTVFFNAPRDVVWSFLTEKDKLGEWYHPAEADLEDAKNYSLYRLDEDGTHIRQVWGRVIEMKYAAKLVTTFCISPFEDRETTITWILEDTVGGTRLSLTHEGIADAAGATALPILMALDRGWDKHFGELRNFINIA